MKRVTLSVMLLVSMIALPLAACGSTPDSDAPEGDVEPLEAPVEELPEAPVEEEAPVDEPVEEEVPADSEDSGE